MLSNIKRVRCPAYILAGCARPVQDMLIGELRQALARRLAGYLIGAPERATARLEEGLELLLDLSQEPELARAKIEACRSLVDEDARLGFIYRLPISAGFGVAIGRTIELALFNDTRALTRAVTALLNVFMTLLDGLLDEAPEIIAPHFPGLVVLVRSGCQGVDVAGAPAPEDHPFGDLCFCVAKLWLRKLADLDDSRSAGSGGSQRTAYRAQRTSTVPTAKARPPARSPRSAFAAAAHHALADEYASYLACFAGGVPRTATALHGRSRWPHWCQALACVVPHGWPPGAKAADLRRFIFAVADYASFLDDVCDYLSDCQASRWNTVSYALYRRKRVPVCEASAMQTALLLRLADDETADLVVESGLRLLGRIEHSAAALRLAPSCVLPLIADLTYGYLG